MKTQLIEAGCHAGNMKLKMNFWNNLMAFSFVWSVTLILLGIWWYLDFDEGLLFAGGIFHLVLSVPAVYLHIEYFIRNMGLEVEIYPDRIIVKYKNQWEEYFTNELEKIILYKAANAGNMQFTGMEGYHFAKVITKSGRKIIITNLMTTKLEKAVQILNDVPYEREKFFFCSTFFWK